MVCSGIDLNHRLGSLEVSVVCVAFCLGGGSWGEGVVLLRFLWGRFMALFLKTFHWAIWVWGFRKASDVFGIVLWC